MQCRSYGDITKLEYCIIGIIRFLKWLVFTHSFERDSIRMCIGHIKYLGNRIEIFSMFERSCPNILDRNIRSYRIPSMDSTSCGIGIYFGDLGSIRTRIFTSHIRDHSRRIKSDCWICQSCSDHSRHISRITHENISPPWSIGSGRIDNRSLIVDFSLECGIICFR